ncbi:MAG: ArnT family glycosyltransferase [Desulfosudaceae bacterium]
MPDNESRRPPGEKNQKLFWIIIVAALFTAYFIMAGRAATVLSPTQDEPLHLISGCAYWNWSDFRLQPENGLASQRWIGLAALLSGDAARLEPGRGTSGIGDKSFNAFAFMEWSGSRLLTASRLSIVLAGGLLLLLITLWSRSLWGWPDAVVSLACGAFSITVLAHASLATSDIFLTLTFFASAWSLLGFIRRPSLPRMLLTGCLCGLAALSKYSALFLGPGVIGMIAVIWFIRRPDRPLFFLGPRLMGLTGAVLVAGLVIWAGYEFRYEALNPDLPEGSFIKPWRELRTNSLPGKTIALLQKHRVLPEAFLYGAEHTYYYSRSRASFFLGRTSSEGHPLYFPLGFLLKTSPMLLAGLVVLSICLVFRRRPPGDESDPLRFRETIWATGITAGIFFLFCVGSDLNIGHRHMLPVYPFLFLWLGGLWSCSGKLKHGRYLLLAGLALHAGIAIATMPAFLSYLNPLAGGSKAGHRIFADSSYDWGQEMYLLADWLENRGQSHKAPQLALFAPMPPRYYGIEGRILFQFGAGYHHGWTFPEIRPGLVAVSATILSGTYFFTNGMSWDKTDEILYRRSRSLIAEARRVCGNDPAAWIKYLKENSDKQWEKIFQNYSRLRIKRLLWLLRKESEPLTRLSDTIFIWELTPEIHEKGDFRSEPSFPDNSIIPTVIRNHAA